MTEVRYTGSIARIAGQVGLVIEEARMFAPDSMEQVLVAFPGSGLHSRWNIRASDLKVVA